MPNQKIKWETSRKKWQKEFPNTPPSKKLEKELLAQNIVPVDLYRMRSKVKPNCVLQHMFVEGNNSVDKLVNLLWRFSKYYSSSWVTVRQEFQETTSAIFRSSVGEVIPEMLKTEVHAFSWVSKAEYSTEWTVIDCSYCRIFCYSSAPWDFLIEGSG